jgi:hypothetical protein
VAFFLTYTSIEIMQFKKKGRERLLKKFDFAHNKILIDIY